MIKTLEDVGRVRKTASRLEKLGLPQKTADRIRRWASKEEKRLRDEAHGW